MSDDELPIFSQYEASLLERLASDEVALGEQGAWMLLALPSFCVETLYVLAPEGYAVARTLPVSWWGHMHARAGRAVDLPPPEPEMTEVPVESDDGAAWARRAAALVDAPRRRLIGADGTTIRLWPAGHRDRARSDWGEGLLHELEAEISKAVSPAIEKARESAGRRFTDSDAVPNAWELRGNPWPAALRGESDIPVRSLADLRKLLPGLSTRSFGEVREMLEGPGVQLGDFYTGELASLRERLALPGIALVYRSR